MTMWRGIARTSVFAVVAIAGAWAQQPVSAQFDVASVKLARDTGPAVVGMPLGFVGFPGGGRFSATNAGLMQIIAVAYDVLDFQIAGGPGWIGSSAAADHFDIEARAEGVTDIGRMRLMIRALIEDRFQLKIHRETKEMPVYALVVKRGSKLLASSPEEQADARPFFEAGQKCPQYKATKMPISALTRALTTPLGRTVIDKTNLDGEYGFSLEWSLSPFAETDCMSIFSSVEQLGFQLEAQKGPVETFVIDHVDRPSAN
jgi:uncharacterized protein (TIGR03435 family)